MHAFFYTDKVCAEPLTEWLHFADLRDSQPWYMLNLVRTVQALCILADELSTYMQPIVNDPFRNAITKRSQQLADSIPYMLHDDRCELAAGGSLGCAVCCDKLVTHSGRFARCSVL